MSITRLKGRKIINIEKTIEKFGYDPSTYKKGSNKLAVSYCMDCSEEFIEEISYGKFSHKCPTYKNNLYICSKCNEWKDKEMFFNSKRSKYGISPSCKTCYQQSTELHEKRSIRKKTSFEKNLPLYMNNQCNQVKNRCVKYNIPFNLTPEYLLELYINQKGICKYSNIPMKKDNDGNIIGWYHPSIDRIDPTKGYIIDNIAWVCFGINACKRQLNLQKFFQLMKNINWNDNMFIQQAT